MLDTEKVPCPVCGALEFVKQDFPGSYDICSICGWEDDAIQFANPHDTTGANRVSLAQAKDNFRQYGSIEFQHKSQKDTNPKKK